jgi:hypothetical protein
MALRHGRGTVPEAGWWLQIGLKAWNFVLGHVILRRNITTITPFAVSGRALRARGMDEEERAQP